MTYEEAKLSFERLFSGEMAEIEARDFLTKLYLDGESCDEIRAAVEVMRDKSIKLDVSDEIRSRLIDNCGTGGDKSGSFNISTTVSVVLASLGCVVAKHGNRSITSKSGSADMLEALGARLEMPNEQKIKMLEDVGFAFLFAANHHPAMKHIMPIRKSLPHRSIFNILGPMTNPTTLKHHLIGVFDFSFAPKIADTLLKTGSTKGFVVCSRDGLDEASVCDITNAIFFDQNGQKEMVIDASEYGLKRADKAELLGGDASQNASITFELLKRGENGAKKDIVLLNSALALMVNNLARDIQDGIAMSTEAIDSKAAFKKLTQIVEVSKKL